MSYHRVAHLAYRYGRKEISQEEDQACTENNLSEEEQADRQGIRCFCRGHIATVEKLTVDAQPRAALMEEHYAHNRGLAGRVRRPRFKSRQGCVRKEPRMLVITRPIPMPTRKNAEATVYGKRRPCLRA